MEKNKVKSGIFSVCVCVCLRGSDFKIDSDSGIFWRESNK